MSNKVLGLEDDILEAMKKKFKSQKIELYSQKTTDDSHRRLSTGSIGLNYITGGGWVYGGLNYLYGSESGGKSTAVIMAMAEASKKGELSVFIDMEYSFDMRYAQMLGVNPELLYLVTPDTFEEGINMAYEFMKSNRVKLLAFDSVASGLLEKQIEGEAGDSIIGVKAKLCSENVPKLAMLAKKQGICLFFINQLRSKIGVMFGSPETEPGGEVWRFAPWIKVDVRKSTAKANVVEEGGEAIGNLVKAVCTKNKTAPPLKRAEYNIIYGAGIDTLDEIATFGARFGVIEKSGNSYSYDGTKLGVGINQLKTSLQDNPEMTDEIEEKINQYIRDNVYNI